MDIDNQIIDPQNSSKHLVIILKCTRLYIWFIVIFSKANVLFAFEIVLSLHLLLVSKGFTSDQTLSRRTVAQRVTNLKLFNRV